MLHLPARPRVLLLALLTLCVTAAPAAATYPGDNGRLVYSGGIGSRTETLYAVEAAPPQTTYTLLPWATDSYAGRPEFTSDGRTVYFDRFWLVGGADNWGMYRMSVDGSGLERLQGEHLEGRHPAPSPDGTKLVFEYRGDLFVRNLATGADTPLTHDVGAPAGAQWHDTEPDWSPDGSEVVFTRRLDTWTGEYWEWGPTHIRVIGADGTGARDLTSPTTDQPDEAPDWSPDGTKVVFTRADWSETGNGNAQISVIAASGGAVTKIAESISGQPNTLAWSPDGQRVTFVGPPTNDQPGVALRSIGATGDLPIVHSNPQLLNVTAIAWQPCPEAGCAGTFSEGQTTVSSSTGSVSTTPSGETVVGITRGNTGDVTFTRPFSCPEGTPTVAYTYNGIDYPATSNGAGSFTATIPAGALVDGTSAVTAKVTCGETVVDVVRVATIALYDPSGNVTNGVTGAAVVGATVKLYKVPGWRARTSPEEEVSKPAGTCQSNDSKAAGAAWSQVAPATGGVIADPLSGELSPAVDTQLTTPAGRYAWDVAAGCWYVVVSKAGFVTKTSPVVGVPPAVLDLDLTLWPVLNHARTVSLGLSGHVRATGKVSSAYRGCRVGVPVEIQRYASGWRRVKTVTTGSTGVFSTLVADRRGKYRAVAVARSALGPGRNNNCNLARSVARVHAH